MRTWIAAVIAAVVIAGASVVAWRTMSRPATAVVNADEESPLDEAEQRWAREIMVRPAAERRVDVADAERLPAGVTFGHAVFFDGHADWWLSDAE